ncbi:RES family NAD+ phosphorylase [Aliiroseovarius sp. F20344]|uniref:RES family NAD+ phosphorylase n=1 Tax=Aliiroseovarius sp. F20344 TaxID=2926414 RepID=UPI001FF438D8|nr:RES family NAD+ phosphorylase [Aliiroseovarius sp. F20344]MCK0142228.1 RES family NAD+ phosphorylase [Aliiroseovarius sp. F20344]
MISFTGIAHRLVFTDQDALLPVRWPEGRFHHSGQFAIYTSLTPEGCGVAIKRYLGDRDAPRHIVPLTVALERVTDLRGQTTASVVWQDERACGQIPSTWELSDAARTSGAQGMLYSSRSRPDLTHLVVFTDTLATLEQAGTPQPFPAQTP